MTYGMDMRREARRSYVEDGASLAAIAETLDISSKTVHRWYQEGAEAGDDWAVARRTTLHAATPTALEAAITGFISIQQGLGEAIRDDASMDLGEKLKRIGELAQCFDKLRAASLTIVNLMLLQRAADPLHAEKARTIGKASS